MRNWSFLTLVVPFATAACAMGDLGVRSVTFDLAPVPVSSWPPGIDAATFVTLPLATGMVMADVGESHCMIDVEGVPDLPVGFQYGVSFTMANDSRDDIPEEATAPTSGHVHGARALRNGGDDLNVLAIGYLSAGNAPGAWHAHIAGQRASDMDLGSLRGAFITLVSPAPEGGVSPAPDVEILHGEVHVEATAAASAPATTGHVH